MKDCSISGTDPFSAVAVLNNAGANNADVVTNQTGKAFLPQNPENFTYDEDGNLKSDGRWNYTWNGENRLVQLEALSTVPEGAKQKLTFQYDHLGRRVRKLAYSWTADHWVLAMDRRFAYDGWNLIAELDASNAVVQTYLWGLDLSGSMQGAGGVGGLLAVQNAGSVHFVSHDGNGNVAALFNANDGMRTAQYEYGPFGELIRKSGAASGLNPFRFSTKYQDEETDFLYYGYRFFNASLGRWINRDPIEEEDGPSVYAFLRNGGPDKIDFLGLEWIVERKGGARAQAWATTPTDTFDGLARKIRLDTTDYTKWAKTSDSKPIPCKKYSIPNTIFVDFGVFKTEDQVPWSIISIWGRLVKGDKADWEKQGFFVSTSEGVIDKEITDHISNPNTHGYVFIGHGFDLGIINTYSHLGEDMSGTVPDRYSAHGIAFLTLKACGSAGKAPVAGKRYRYNAWESNVSTRGRFTGYTDTVNTLNEIFLWVSAPGQNNKP